MSKEPIQNIQEYLSKYKESYSIDITINRDIELFCHEFERDFYPKNKSFKTAYDLIEWVDSNLTLKE